jgi:hypothetical protein
MTWRVVRLGKDTIFLLNKEVSLGAYIFQRELFIVPQTVYVTVFTQDIQRCRN